jgi:hypothetical protein
VLAKIKIVLCVLDFEKKKKKIMPFLRYENGALQYPNIIQNIIVLMDARYKHFKTTSYDYHISLILIYWTIFLK